jgi:uncharacterized membrane protein (DUF373 family)
MRRLARFLDDERFLRFSDRAELQLIKLLGLVLIVVMVVASLQLVTALLVGLLLPGPAWVGERLTGLLGDLLNLLIGLEVLQNITSYLRKRVVQIELVLVTAMTALARKVIVLPGGAESKPQLLIGLGVAVLCLALAYWLVRQPGMPRLSRDRTRTAPARSFPEQDPSVPPDGAVLPRSEEHPHG